MDKKQTEYTISSIKQKIQAKFDEGFNLLSRYENVELNEKKLRKANFQMDSLEIDVRLLKNKSNKIKKLQNRLNEISKELQEKSNILSQLRQSKQYYNDLLSQNIKSEANKTFQDYLNDISKKLTNVMNEIEELKIKETDIKQQLNGFCK